MASEAFLEAGSGFPGRPPPYTAFFRLFPPFWRASRKAGGPWMVIHRLGVWTRQAWRSDKGPPSAAFRRLAPLGTAWLPGAREESAGRIQPHWHLPDGDGKV